MTDGWHTVARYLVFLLCGRIIRVLSDDKQNTMYIYRRSKSGGYDQEYGLTPAAFRSGLRRGTLIVK